MLLLLPACVTISNEDYQERISWNAEPEDTSDSSGEGMLSLTGNVSIPENVLLPADSAQVALVNVLIDLADGSVFGDVVGETTVESLEIGQERPYSLKVPLVPEDEHFSAFPNTDLAVFVLGAYVDEGDGSPGEGDVFVGANVERYLAYARNITSDTDGFSEGEGWYLMRFGDDDRPADILPIEDAFVVYDMEGNLLLNRLGEQPFSGVVIPDSTPNPMVALIHLGAIQDLVAGEDVVTPTLGAVEVQDIAQQHAWRYPDGIGRPPAGIPSPLFDWDGTEVDYSGAEVEFAYYVGVAFDDADGNGMWTFAGDVEYPYAESLSAPTPHLLIWFQPTGFAAASVVEDGYPMGWSMVEAGTNKVRPWSTPMALGETE